MAFKWRGDCGSWSLVGIDAVKLTIGQTLPTMNFGWFNDETRDEDFCRTTVHEVWPYPRMHSRASKPASSIMCYFYPTDWTLDGIGTPMNVALSELDKTSISKMYPFRTHNEGKLAVTDIHSWYPPIALNSRSVQFTPPYREVPRIVLRSHRAG